MDADADMTILSRFYPGLTLSQTRVITGQVIEVVVKRHPDLRSVALNLAALHEWLKHEHDYDGSLKSVQRYFKRTFPAPAIRARRRVETPIGAQAQVDWAEYPGVVIGNETVNFVAMVMTLSWSRKRAVVWARSQDMLSWQACQTACL
ncbi:hypothetical protein ACOI1H_24505, partial [Loktanella sp. DJP18]|uniref:hypothetical protein n=1 Tax=Loktanella sp. DJP18 TaxID=3409788 RepID=UPI003BB66323